MDLDKYACADNTLGSETYLNLSMKKKKKKKKDERKITFQAERKI
jgi:hypothetical protein